MKRARFVFIFGVWVAILPYLGFPLFWKNILISLSGLVFCYFGYILFKENKKSRKGEKIDSFSESNPSNEK